MQRFVLKVLLFVFLVAGMNRATGLLMFNGWKNPNYYLKEDEFFKHYAADCNVLFFGSSRTFRQIDPVLFDSLNALDGQHTNSYMLASSASALNETLVHINEVLNAPRTPSHLKCLVVEVDDRVYVPKDNLYTPRASCFITWNTLTPFLTRVYAEDGPLWYKISQTGYYISSWLIDAAQLGYGSEKVRGSIEYDASHKSYEWMQRQGHTALNYDLPKYRSGSFYTRHQLLMQDTAFTQLNCMRIKNLEAGCPHPGNYNPAVLAAYTQLAAQLAKRGVETLFVLPLRGGLSPKLKCLFEALPESKIDMASRAIKIPELHYTHYWFDRGHLNSDGVKLYTDAFARAWQELQTPAIWQPE